MRADERRVSGQSLAHSQGCLCQHSHNEQPLLYQHGQNFGVPPIKNRSKNQRKYCEAAALILAIRYGQQRSKGSDEQAGGVLDRYKAGQIYQGCDQRCRISQEQRREQ